MRIQHNIMAMNAYRNYNTNTSALSKNLEKLSSGYKINRAGDDAAGLAISEKMRAQITGLNAAQKNVKDGVSLVKTAEGAMQEIQDMLNRMDYLATQSANGTYQDAVDRENLQAEVNQLREEINRIADSANFNGIKLLDGSMADGYTNTVKGETIEMPAGALAVNPVDGTPANSGTGMILKKDGAEKGKTSVTVNFQNLAMSGAGDDAEIALTLGADTYTLKVDSTGTEGWDANKTTYTLADPTAVDFSDGEAIATAFKTAFTALGDDLKLDGQIFTVSGSGSELTFTQKADPTDATEVVDANMAATVTLTPPAGGDGDDGTPGVYSAEITTAFANGDTLTIGGKTITFGTGDGEIDATTEDDATKQAAAIAGLFANDANWTVAAAAGKLTFTQKTASTTDVLADPVATGAGTVTGAMAAASTEKDAYADGDMGSYTLDVTQFADGESVTIDGVTMKFVTGTPAADSNEVQIGANADATAANIKAYLDGKTTNVDVTVDGADASKLVLTEKEAGSFGDIEATSPAAPKVTKEITGVPTYTETTAADATGNGAWEIDLNGLKAKLTAGDTFTIGGKTFEYSTTETTGSVDADTGHVYIKNDIADDAAIATAVVTAVGANAANGMTFAVDGTTDTQINIGQGTAAEDAVTLNDSDPLATATSAGTTGALAVGDETNSTVKKASHEAALTTALADGEQLKITVDGKDYVLKAGSSADIDTDTATNVSDQLDDIVAALNGDNAFKADYVASKSADNTKLIITQKTAGDPAADGKDPTFAAEVTKTATGVIGAAAEETAPVDPTQGDPAGSATGTYNVSTTKNVQGAAEGAEQLASTTLDLSKLAGVITDGTTLTIGEDTYTFALGKDSKYAGGDNVIDLTKFESMDAKAIIEAGTQLSNVANQVFTIGFDQGNSKLSIHETNGQDVYGTDELGTVDAFKSQIYLNKAGKTTQGTALTLQIGDTSDEFNQMKLSVKDMHTYAMSFTNADGKNVSIADIDIGTQDGAQKAVDVIKNAINYVSSVRGTLGATQNRLEHTQNNLSVMAENIQDAESTIRDTDVAEEMMSYVKNNILVQSAQAMLAQANQVPQGVLQLLG